MWIKHTAADLRCTQYTMVYRCIPYIHVYPYLVDKAIYCGFPKSSAVQATALQMAASTFGGATAMLDRCAWVLDSQSLVGQACDSFIYFVHKYIFKYLWYSCVLHAHMYPYVIM